MSLRKHLQTIAVISQIPVLLYRVRRYFRLPSITLSVALRRAGLGQADLVICLLRIGTARSRKFVERLIGKPISVIHREIYQRTVVALERVAPRVAWVTPENPCRRSTHFHAIFPLFRPGRTIAQLLMQGVRRREVRLATRRGWVKFA